MQARTRIHKRLATGLAALMCCAVISPVASAAIPDSGGSSRAADSISDYERHVYGVGATLSDARALDGTGVNPATVLRHTTQFEEPTPAPIAAGPTTVVRVVPESRFDWGDAGVGIGIGMGAAALLAATVLALIRRQPHALRQAA